MREERDKNAIVIAYLESLIMVEGSFSVEIELHIVYRRAESDGTRKVGLTFSYAIPAHASDLLDRRQLWSGT